MGVSVDDVLALVRGVVDLSPHEALDEAQDFLTRQGYSVTYRTSNTLTVKRQVSDNATEQESMLELIVMALPQSGGGVRIKVRGNDREAVRDHQAAWLEWSETLPKREPEQPGAAVTMESVTRDSGGQSNFPAPGSTAYEQMVWAQGVVITDMTPAQVLEQAATHMASRGFAIESRLGNTMNFSFHEGPNVFVGLVLLLLGILPGILYFLLAGGDRRTTLLVNEEGEGCRVYVSGDGGAPLDELRTWVLGLPGSVIPQ
jgi:hypothetical protein